MHQSCQVSLHHHALMWWLVRSLCYSKYHWHARRNVVQLKVLTLATKGKLTLHDVHATLMLLQKTLPMFNAVAHLMSQTHHNMHMQSHSVSCIGWQQLLLKI